MDRPSPGRRGVALALLAAAALVLVGGAVGAGALQEDRDRPSGEEVLDRMDQRYASAETVVGTATVTASNGTHTERATVEFALAEPNRTHVTVTRDGESVEFGTDGDVAWVAGRNRSVVADLPSPNASAPWPRGVPGDRPGPHDGAGPGADATPGDRGTPDGPWSNRSADAPNVTATVTGVEDVDGQRAYVVVLEPEADLDREVSATLWVATDDYRLLRASATDGTNRTEVRFERTEFDVSVHDSEFAPPEDRVAVTGVERFEDREALADATDLALPALETGAFAGGQRVTRPGSEAVIQRYRTDEGNVTLVTATGEAGFADRLENGTAVTVGDRNATAVTVEDRSAVVWTEDGVTTAVVVDGSTEAAVAVARGL